MRIEKAEDHNTELKIKLNSILNILSDVSPISSPEHVSPSKGFGEYTKKQKDLLEMMRVKNDTMTTKKINKLNRKKLESPDGELDNTVGSLWIHLEEFSQQLSSPGDHDFPESQKQTRKASHDPRDFEGSEVNPTKRKFSSDARRRKPQEISEFYEVR